MELDELKNNWADYDKKLSANLKLNEELLRKMNLNSSKREMQKVLIYELINILLLIILILYVFPNLFYYINQLRYSIPGFFSIGIALIFLVFSVIRMKDLINIDYYSLSVVKVQKRILTLKKKTLGFRKFELMLIPLFVLPILPILFKALHNIDIYQNLTLLIFEIVAILGLVYPLLFWVNRSLYDKKFKNAENLLNELKQFENEQ